MTEPRVGIVVQGKRYLTIDEATEVARVSRRTIYNWIAAGKVDYLRMASGSIRIQEDTLYRDADMTPLEVKSR